MRSACSRTWDAHSKIESNVSAVTVNTLLLLESFLCNEIAVELNKNESKQVFSGKKVTFLLFCILKINNFNHVILSLFRFDHW